MLPFDLFFPLFSFTFIFPFYFIYLLHFFTELEREINWMGRLYSLAFYIFYLFIYSYLFYDIPTARCILFHSFIFEQFFFPPLPPPPLCSFKANY